MNANAPHPSRSTEVPLADVPLPVSRSQEGALGPYLRAIRARIGIVLLITAAAVGAAVALVVERSPEYEATAHVLVAPVSSTEPVFLGIQLLRESGDPTRTVQTAATLIDSAAAAELTASEIGSGYDAERIEEDVTVGPVGESNIVGVTAKANDPELAAQIANTFASESLAERADRLATQLEGVIANLEATGRPADSRQAADLAQIAALGDPTLTISQLAEVPLDPIGAPDWLIVALALLAGVMLASVAALLMETLNRRVRGSAELLGIAPFPVLARLPPLPRGRKQPDPFEIPSTVREAFRTLQIQLDQRASGMSRSVVVTSPSTGDGKTTTALNLAFSLVAAGHEVILMDFDLRKPSIADRLGLPASPGLISLLTSEGRLEELLQPVPSLAPLRVVPAASGPGDVSLLQVIARKLDEIFYQAAALADYIVIDTPPLGEVGDALTVAAHADELIVVGRAGNTDRAAVELTRELLERSGIAPAGWVLVGDEAAPRATGYPGPAPRRSRSPG